MYIEATLWKNCQCTKAYRPNYKISTISAWTLDIKLAAAINYHYKP